MNDTDTVKNRYCDGSRFYIFGKFDTKLRDNIVAPLNKKIEELSSVKDPTISLYIDSPGGDGFICLQLIDLVELAKRRGITVRTIVSSHALSAGSMLAVTGSTGHRYIGQNAEHLVHYGQFGGQRTSTPLQLDRESARWKRWSKSLLEHYQKYTTIPNIPEVMNDDNYWIAADKCIKWGLADKYTDELA